MEARADLWERDQQRAAAAATVAAAREGNGRALFLVGEAGLGKTTLLEELATRNAEDLAVARARCDPMEASLPYGVLAQVVHGLGGETDLLAATAGGDARTSAPYRALRWLEEVARRPILIALDDLHWADPDSLAVLGFLCRRLVQLPVAVVASLRPFPEAAADLAWRLVGNGDAAIERLLPLTQQAAGSVLAERLGRPVGRDVSTRTWRLTGGNPFLLGLAATTLAQGAAADPGTEDVALSDVERRLVLTRFAGLSADGTRWARAAAVLGIEFPPELVATVAGLEDDAAAAAAEAVWRTGLARAGVSGRGVFVHPLFGQLLYEDIPPPVRADMHARAFAALAERGMDDLAAEHAIRANLAGDARALRVLTETGRRALRAGAPATAALRLEAAVRLSGPGGAPPLLELGEAYMQAGRAREASATLAQALGSDLTLVQRVTALTELSRVHSGRGDFDRATEALEAAVALAEDECPEAVVQPLLRHGVAVMMTAGPAAALPLAARARAMARGSSPALEGAAAAHWALLSYFCGDPEGLALAEAVGRRLLADSAAEVAADLRSGIVGTRFPLAITAMHAEQFELAEATFRQGIEEAERTGAVTNASAIGVVQGLLWARTRAGDVLDAADRLLAWADLVPLTAPIARTLRCYELLEMGEPARSAEECDLARATATGLGIWQSDLWLDHVEGLRLLRQGEVHAASEAYRQLEDRYEGLGVGEPCIVPFGRHAVVAHTRAGRLDHAERVVAWLDERSNVLPCRWPAAAAAAGKACLAGERGDHAVAEKGYQTALDILGGASLPLEEAEVLIEYGTFLRRVGRPREARESLRHAAGVAAPAGGLWLASKAEVELAAAGGRRRARRRTDELTPQEQRVARLAATGASDKDIAAHLVVSVRTVRTHLEHVYAKLGLHSRRELMAMGDQLDTVISRQD